MSIHHHPHGELLIGYASGATDEAVSLLVATHLALCPQCRRKVSAAEEAGGALLSELAPVAMESDAFAKLSSRLDGPRPIESHFSEKKGGGGDISVPEPLRSYLGGGFDTIKWQHIVGGISQYRIFQRGAVSIRLIRAEPGSAVAMHTHRGEELTMVMEGGFTDATGHYNRGDVQTTSPAITHSPATIPGGPCINLAVTDSPLIFQNWPAKIVGKLFGSEIRLPKPANVLSLSDAERCAAKACAKFNARGPSNRGYVQIRKIPGVTSWNMCGSAKRG